MTQDEIDEIQTLNVALKSDFSYFNRFVFYHQFNKRFIIGRHHEVIAEALQRVANGNCKRLIIQVAPRFGKTELAVKSFISYGLALNPKAKYIHLSYSDELALDNSEAIKDIITSEWYQRLFPRVRLKKDAKAKNKWYTTEGGGVLARSAAGSVTGFGAGQVDDPDADFEDELFGGAIVIDDPIKVDDADSDTVRGRVNNRFDSTIRTRTNSRNTPIIVIMQRTHPEDLAGYLQRDDESDEWEVISLPVINEDGSALWPFKMTVDEAQKLEKANDIVFQRQYMQNPQPLAGLLFPIQSLSFYSPDDMEAYLKDPDYTACFADPAGDGGDDFASGGFKLIGNKIYVTDMIYNTEGTDFNEQELVKLVQELKAMTTGIEGVFGWEETAKRVRAELEEKGHIGETRILRPRTNKHSRILNRSAFVRNYFVFRSDWQQIPQYAKFMRNLTTYLKIQAAGQKNKHDEAPDLCEMAASYFEKNFAHLYMPTK